MSPRISVVVPVYNVAAYLETCLESLAQQTSADLEIVMVDDGSTDESPEIAKRFAADDGRFRLVHQANAGLSAARNTGIDHAAGEFLAFVDSDDVLPRHALELLVGALDRTGSDFASGDVRRLTSFGTTRTRFLVKAFERTRLKTHVTRFPALLADRTAWNKLFRRSFWDRHGFRFPEGAIFEDTPVILPAHVLAGSVDVIEQTVYFWRTREGAELSITQRRTEPKALRDRVAAVDYVSRFLADRGLKRTKSQYDRSVVGDDFRHYLNVLPRADEDYRRLFLDLVNDFLDRAADSALDQPLAIERLAWQLVRRTSASSRLSVGCRAGTGTTPTATILACGFHAASTASTRSSRWCPAWTTCAGKGTYSGSRAMPISSRSAHPRARHKGSSSSFGASVRGGGRCG